MATTGAEIMDKVKDIKGTDVSGEKTNAMISGGAVGLLMGLYYGFSKDKNMLICAAIGGITGAVIARLAMPN